ncbi:MAG: sulfotransferase family protein [Candidatus Planktophila sp.]
MANLFTPVFIGGTGRSGTTIVLNLLSRHPDFHGSMPREIKYLTSRHGLIDLVFTRPMRFEENLRARRNNLVARLLPLTGRSQIDSFEQEIFGAWWSGTSKKGTTRGLVQGIPREILEREVEAFKTQYGDNRIGAARQFFESLSQAQMQDKPRRYFGDSTPVNMMQSDLIFKLLPHSKFINVIRDGRDVAASVVKERWGPVEHYSALKWWENRICQAHSSLTRIPKERILEIRIEDLVVHERESTLQRILTFLNLEHSSRLEKYFADEVIPERLHAGRWKAEVADPEKFEGSYLQILNRLDSKGIDVKRF